MKSPESPTKAGQQVRVQQKVLENHPLVHVQNDVNRSGKEQLDLATKWFPSILQFLHNSVQQKGFVGYDEKKLDFVHRENLEPSLGIELWEIEA